MLKTLSDYFVSERKKTMTERSGTLNNPDVLEDVTVTLNNQDDSKPEDEQPLLRDFGIASHLPSIRILLVCILVIILFGSAGIGAWLLVGGGGSGGASDTSFHLVNRTSWGASVPKATIPYPHPPATYVVVIHTDTDPCDSQSVCSAEVREIQCLHMDRNFSDIAYNFLVGGDGKIYEGRGWDAEGAFARGFNKKSLGIAFIGNFNENAPPKQQLEEAQVLLAVSVKNKKLSTDYTLVGHLQVSQTSSPGQALYKILKTWPHWKDCYMTSC